MSPSIRSVFENAKLALVPVGRHYVPRNDGPQGLDIAAVFENIMKVSIRFLMGLQLRFMNGETQ